MMHVVVVTLNEMYVCVCMNERWLKDWLH